MSLELSIQNLKPSGEGFTSCILNTAFSHSEVSCTQQGCRTRLAAGWWLQHVLLWHQTGTSNPAQEHTWVTSPFRYRGACTQCKLMMPAGFGFSSQKARCYSKERSILKHWVNHTLGSGFFSPLPHILMLALENKDMQCFLLHDITVPNGSVAICTVACNCSPTFHQLPQW